MVSHVLVNGGAPRAPVSELPDMYLSALTEAYTSGAATPSSTMRTLHAALAAEKAMFITLAPLTDLLARCRCASPRAAPTLQRPGLLRFWMRLCLSNDTHCTSCLPTVSSLLQLREQFDRWSCCHTTSLPVSTSSGARVCELGSTQPCQVFRFGVMVVVGSWRRCRPQRGHSFTACRLL